MSSDRKLAWIQANRTKTSRSRPVGGVIERLVGQLAARTEDERVAFDAVNEVVDEAFRAGCHLASDRRGVVIVRVKEASQVYAMRLRWHTVLAKALRCPLGGVRFEYGTAGQSLSDGSR